MTNLRALRLATALMALLVIGGALIALRHRDVRAQIAPLLIFGSCVVVVLATSGRAVARRGAS